MMSTLNKKSRRRMLETPDCLSISPVNKKLNFEVMDDGENHELQELHQFDLELDSIDLSLDISEELMKDDKFSPCRTRSGVVYESGLKRRKILANSRRRKKASTRLRTRTSSGHSGTGSLADCSENDSDDHLSDHMMSDLAEAEERLSLPPPLNYLKEPVSRFSHRRPQPGDIPSSPISSFLPEDRLSPLKQTAWSQPRHLLLSSPVQSPSPPTNTMKAMRLFDVLGSPNSACAISSLISSPRSTPRVLPLKSRLLFTEDGEPRRSSFPSHGSHRRNLNDCDSTATSTVKLANVNPFTPTAMMASFNKKRRNSSVNTSLSPRPDQDLQHSLGNLSDPCSDDDDAGRFSPLPNKRVRVSDINITRYQEEFLELAEIATGSFGMVKQARHRLDGIVYAIKVSKNRLRINSHDEKMAMNEVFAHAALMKHKHVVRYFNSWVEKGQVYIQNEFCEGGSLQKQIEEHRLTGLRFSEADLKRILVQVAKGLHYIHSNQLVHLDIKPGNILIAVEHTPTPSPQRLFELSDSGAASGDLSPRVPKLEPSSGESSPGDPDKICYKIGDLGHVAPVQGGDFSPEEGDCRYMAPEFLEMEVDRSRLTKADIFSLGLTIYEAASLRVLPRNSTDSQDYEQIKRGKLPYMQEYSEEFNCLLARMVHPDPAQRPAAPKLLANCELNPGMNKSKWQLTKELKETREKLMQLEAQLSSANKENKKVVKRKLVGRGSARVGSCQL